MNILAKTANYIWLHAWGYRATERRQARYVDRLKGHQRINVVFMAVDLSYWRYQHLYELMAADKRFNASIVLSPCVERQQKEEDLNRLRNYFDQSGISYVDFQTGQPPVDVKELLQPDIIFFAQPYEYLLCREHDCRNFYDRLVCYMPYGFWTSTGKLSYNLHFHNRAWRLYYSTSLHLAEAEKVADNHGFNVRIVGYANADDYLRPQHQEVWKIIGYRRQRKRIIWAPHYSIGHSPMGSRSNFLWMADLMVQLAQTYADTIQIAFKPHPSLLTQLYRHAQWGKERTDRYYELWRTMPNTQLETGGYADLFMTSDAMIHDSGSFAVEYHYSRQPVMFIAKDMKSILATQSEFGREAYGIHYIGQDEGDIRRFIDDTVLAGNDPLLPERRKFYNDYLLPPNGQSVAQNVVDDIVESLNL